MGGSDGLEPSTTGVEVASELWRTLGCNDLNGPSLSQTATRQTFLSTSAKPGIAGRPSQPAPLATLTRTPLGPWAELSIALTYLCIQGVELGVIYERLPE